MSAVYSREYLRNLPVLRRQQLIIQLVSHMYHSILPFVTRAAAAGDSLCLYDMTAWREQHRYSQVQGKQPVAVSDSDTQYPIDEYIDEIVEGLKEKFPDCVVTFLEDWVETQKGVRVLKKCIKIDWS